MLGNLGSCRSSCAIFDESVETVEEYLHGDKNKIVCASEDIQ